MSGHRNHLEHYEQHLFTGSFYRLGVTLLILAVWLFPVLAVSAQSEPGKEEARLVLSGYDAQDFPEVQLRVGAWDAQGNFLSGLGPAQVEVREGSGTVRPTKVEVAEVGVQFILAVNISPVLSSQEQGASQYEHFRQTLLRWAREQQGQEDDFSFSTPTGLYVIHSNKPSEWIQALQDYQPDLAKMQPSLNSLAEALNLASEPGADETRRRAILYVTPALPATLDANLPELSKRAADLGVKVFIWLVAPPSSAPLSPDHPLLQMAESTGGAFRQVYFPDSALDVDPLLDPLRKMYLVYYQSALRQSGDHAISVQVNRDGQELVSNTQAFSVTVRPPNPIFLSPPAVVELAWSAAESSGLPSVLEPEEVELKILVEFPDAHARALKSTRLYMDGELVAENTAPPYEQFSWSVKDLQESGQHLLRVEVVDELGLTGASTELPVEVVVPAPLQAKLTGSVVSGLSTRSLLVLGSVVVSGAALVMVLVFNDRKGKTALALTRSSRINGKSGRRSSAQTTTRPVARAASASLEHNGVIEVSASPARFVSLNEEEQPVVGAIIPITGQEMTIGSDPQRATQVLESPTVDGLHARVFRNGSGSFYLADGNSVAGTWINFAPITAHGARLEHGDLVHIGRVMFRFEMTDPLQAKLPQVKVIGPDDSTAQGAGDPK